MTNQEILGEFLSLPAEAQSQVVSLIAFLKQKYIYSEPLSTSSNVDLVNDPTDILGHHFLTRSCRRMRRLILMKVSSLGAFVGKNGKNSSSKVLSISTQSEIPRLEVPLTRGI